jgi:MFS family permease
MHSYRLIWYAVATILAAFGIVFAVAVFGFAVLALALTGAVMGCSVLMISAGGEWTPTRRSQLKVVGAIGALILTVVAGLGSVLGGPAVELVIVCAIASPWVLSWGAAQVSRLTAGPVDRRAPAPSTASDPTISKVNRPRTRQDADPHSMSNEDLWLAWRRSFALVNGAHTATERAQAAELRRRYLDELERRDPAGFERWIAAGARAASDPGRYMTHGSDE